MHILSQCQVKISGVQMLQHTSATYQVVDDLLELFDGLQFI
jgi:hypothetical protein